MKQSSKAIKIFYTSWVPILPFLAYWLIAYYMLYFGAFVAPDINTGTHLFIVSFILLFLVGFVHEKRKARFQIGLVGRFQHREVHPVLFWSSLMFFLGSILLLLDRLQSGAGSVDLIQNELSSIREEYSTRTTILTTLAVIPQSFKIIALGTYFYYLHLNARVPKNIHFLILSAFAAEILNMGLSANRGAIFWGLSYVLLYSVYYRGINVVKWFFSLRNILMKSILIGISISAYLYFLWVAENRVVSNTAEYLGRLAFYELKDDYQDYNRFEFSSIGGRYQLQYYLTHGFEYTQAIIAHSPWLNLDFLSPLGIRAEAQIQRVLPFYIHPAKKNLLMWLSKEGLNLSGWPSIFGASAAYFGTFGALVFSFLLGKISGFVIRTWEQTKTIGASVLIVLLFTSLNMSFDWIIRNFDQFAALFFGIRFLKRK